MYTRYWLMLLGGLGLLITACQKGSDNLTKASGPGVDFVSVVNKYNSQTLRVPEGCQTDVIYRGAADSVMTDSGVMRLSKRKIDFLAYIPINGSSEHGQLFMNHELRDSNSVLGDGGGMSWLEVKKVNG